MVKLFKYKKQLKNNCTSDKLFQYSKILTTLILSITIVFNSWFYIYIVPESGKLGITEDAFSALTTILNSWNIGTIVMYCGYFAKLLFETKWEKQNEKKGI